MNAKICIQGANAPLGNELFIISATGRQQQLKLQIKFACQLSCLKFRGKGVRCFARKQGMCMQMRGPHFSCREQEMDLSSRDQRMFFFFFFCVRMCANACVVVHMHLWMCAALQTHSINCFYVGQPTLPSACISARNSSLDTSRTQNEPRCCRKRQMVVHFLFLLYYECNNIYLCPLSGGLITLTLMDLTTQTITWALTALFKNAFVQWWGVHSFHHCHL